MMTSPGLLLRRRLHDGSSRATGAVIVELAIFAPVMALLVFGVIDLGRAYALKSRLANAAREGAAFAQYFPSKVQPSCDPAGNYADIVDKTIHQDASLALTPADVSVYHVTAGGSSTPYSGCSETFTISPPDSVIVQAQRSMTILTPLLSSLVGSSVTLTGSNRVVLQR